MLKFDNYRVSSKDSNIVIFYFDNLQRAEYFEQLLLIENIPFNKREKVSKNTQTWFDIEVKYFKRAVTCNQKVSEKFRQPFIADRVLRYFTLGFFFVALLLAAIGFVVKNL